MLPELVGTRSRRYGGYAQVAYFAGHQIAHDQAAGTWTPDINFDVCRCGAKRVGMELQGLAHAGHCSRKRAIREFEGARSDRQGQV
jgi:hypothetical protein